jgi:hypothetical protein
MRGQMNGMATARSGMLVTTAAVNAPETSGNVVRDNLVCRLDSSYAMLELNGTVHTLIVAITTKMSARIMPAAGLRITTLWGFGDGILNHLFWQRGFGGGGGVVGPTRGRLDS